MYREAADVKCLIIVFPPQTENIQREQISVLNARHLLCRENARVNSSEEGEACQIKDRQELSSPSIA